MSPGSLQDLLSNRRCVCVAVVELLALVRYGIIQLDCWANAGQQWPAAVCYQSRYSNMTLYAPVSDRMWILIN